MIEQVAEFHAAFGVEKQKELTPEFIELRNKLFKEEYDEYLEAVENNDLVEIADAITDMMYILVGSWQLVYDGMIPYYTFGVSSYRETQSIILLIDYKLQEYNNNLLFTDDLIGAVTELANHHDIFFCLHELFHEVHRSNMSKLDASGKPIYREDGKILKSDLYFVPNLKEILIKNGRM